MKSGRESSAIRRKEIKAMFFEKLLGSMFRDIDRRSEGSGDDFQTAIRFYLALINAR